MWLLASELAGVVGLPGSDRNVREQLKKLATENPELARKRQGTRGTEYHISLLPTATQTALYKIKGQIKVGDQVLALPKKKSQQTYCREALWARWNKTNHAAQAKAQFALRTVQAVSALKRNGIKLMDAYDSVCAEYDIALSTLRRHCAMVKGIDESDWAPALLPKHFEASQAKKKNQFAFVSPEAWEAFKADYLRLEQPPMTKCYERIVRNSQGKDWVIPSLKSLNRRLDYEVPVQQQVLLREGEHALHQLYPPQERSVEGLHALEWINGDGYQHNVFVKWFNGEVLRPKTWFWQDIYSRKIIGWRCDISENTDSIRLSFMDVCEKYGIPKHITLDNTRAAANKSMTGGVANRYRFKVKEDDPKGIMTMLVGEGNVHWSSVILGKGHGQAKPVERMFGVGGLEDYIDCDPACYGAYTGKNPMAKPDNYGSREIDAEEFLQVIARGVEMYNARANRDTEICKGFMSFDQAFAASYETSTIRKATKVQLQMMMLQAEPVRISKHGTLVLNAGGSIKGRKNRYFNEVLMNYVSKKLVARFDPLKLHDSIEVYTLNGVHICTAECLEKVAFGDTQAARETKRKRTQFTKNNKLAAAAKISIDQLELAAMMRPAAEEIIPETKVVMMVRPTSIGNTAAAMAYDYEHDSDHQAECAANFSESVAYLRELKSKNRL
ncbi:MAG: Mu transposase C-terminal domain-containing protein [Gammaproteobacteria bacterium]|nr:Mu transposase C-terminal domain-containing protein [Gammaproteobacteria bacterium]MBU1477473.1 Mu transposase C-terminal domain-containing protein [Gammaproteobacteria bacterium]MBU2002636.1 Mu transposase C-terminal domain-containing protein [Gammaproteobacteria bacterium]MBU2131811.1 Mu transposase C-terminal domain-containing protein [Gammaproteobacteria bacterium]MBU2186546.1 Mu transposase C-terminal domain-containing protein [Gammaproteobacteria bacterium]